MKLRRTVGYAAIAAALIMPWEGLLLTARPDMLAHGLPTVCYGVTPHDRPVKVGDKYTKDQCKEFLREDIPKFYAQIAPCIHVKLSNNEKAALVSLAYNVGPDRVCKSTSVRYFNAGKHWRGCINIANFKRANGRVVQGLVNRRRAEVAVCLTKDKTQLIEADKSTPGFFQRGWRALTTMFKSSGE